MATPMSQRDRKEVIDKLKLELSILRDGGYGRSVRTPWRETEIFRDSITCLNYGVTENREPCDQCFLIEFVPDAHHAKEIPCHLIPLNDKGDTIESLERSGNRARLEEALAGWLEATIRRLEEEMQNA